MAKNRNAYQREWKRMHRDSVNDTRRRAGEKSRLNQAVSAMLWNAKTRALRGGIEFGLVRQDVFIPKCCPVLGIPLIVGGRTNNSPSLDRLNPSLGYVRGNVMVMSLLANRIKSNVAATEVLRVGMWMMEHIVSVGRSDRKKSCKR